MAKGKKRILVLIKPKDPEDPSAGNVSIGTPREFCRDLAGYNTAPDGSQTSRLGTAVLHGPGFVVEYAMGHDELMQAMIVVNHQDFAWPVISKMCRDNGWKMQDTESGQIFG